MQIYELVAGEGPQQNSMGWWRESPVFSEKGIK